MQRSLSMERNGIPLSFTMFGMWLLYPKILGYNNHIQNIVKLNGFPLRSIERLRCIVCVYLR
jgi:hypothetical protein